MNTSTTTKTKKYDVYRIEVIIENDAYYEWTVCHLMTQYRWHKINCCHIKIRAVDSEIAICTAAQRSLMSISDSYCENTTVQSLQEILKYMINTNKQQVTFIWVPGHVGVTGKEIVNSAARNGTERKK